MTSDLARMIEALLFVSDEPIPASVLAQALETDRLQVEAACEELAGAYEDRGSGLAVRNVAGGWRLFTHPDVAPQVEGYIRSSRQARITKAALESLSIVAYKQPVTRHQVSAIRGVNVDGVVRTLLARGLITEVGADPDTGGGLFRTTESFLERMGLQSLAELPSLAPLLPDVAGLDTFDLDDL